MLRNIASDPNWSWANNDIIPKPLRAAQGEVASAVANDEFIKTALAMDWPEVRKHLPQSEFDKGLQRFTLALDDPLSRLVREVKLVLRQQGARMQVS